MTDFFIMDKGEPFVQVTSPDPDHPVTAVSKVGPVDDWRTDLAHEQMEEHDMTVRQMTRFFGREAAFVPVEEFSKRDRRVAKRGVKVKSQKSEFDLLADGQIAKTDKKQQIVFGWAYVTHDKSGQVNIDKSGDFVDEVEEIEKSAYDFVLESRASDADHTNVKGGTLVESIVFTPEKIAKMGIPEGSVPLGWWLGFKIEDKATWDRVEKGELTAFSIHGSGTRQKVADD